MKKLIPFIVMATLCLFFKVNGQFYKPSDKTIRMGETLPDSFYQTIHSAVEVRTGKVTTIQLNNYRDKLIILDFWATWCGPCLRSLIDLNSIQKTIKNDDFIIIPVTNQDTKTTSSTFKKYRWDFTSIVNDTTLGPLFPTSGIPFQIWIKDGKLIANPQPQYATSENILKTASGMAVNMPSAKRDADSSKPLWQYNKKMSYYSSFATGDTIYSQHRLTFNQKDSLSVLFCFNVPVVRGIFYPAFEMDISKYMDPEEGSGFELEVDDFMKTILLNTSPVNQRFCYSYNLSLNKKITKVEALKIMQQELNNYFGLAYGIEAVVEKRPRKLAVLDFITDKASTEKLLKSKGGVPVNKNNNATAIMLKNTGFSSILSAISKVRIAPNTAFINRTGLDNNFKVDFQLPYSLNGDFEGAQRHMANYGLSLTIKEELQPILVIRTRKADTSPTTN